MERSEELCRIVHRWLVAVQEGDRETVSGRISADAGTLLIGTDGAEWWRGEVARLMPGQQVEETGGFPITWGQENIEAWEEGNVGWASSRVAIAGDGESFDLRITYVFRLERGEWRMVQGHWSLPTSNEEVGMEGLTVSLEQLERAIQSERPDLSGSAAVDGTVTIVFTDIVDSTILTARLGDHAWMELVRRHRDVIHELTEEHGGAVVETQGDGTMLAFSSARRAVACAQAIQAGISRRLADSPAPIRVRIGVHTGDALHEADHFFGTTVNYAARVASHALGGEVIVSDLVRQLVGGSGAEFGQGREVELKGLDGSHRVFAVSLA